MPTGATSQYLEELIEDTPDLYLSELRAMLWEHRGVDVSESTIHRALKRRGYTYKKVRDLLLPHA